MAAPTKKIRADEIAIRNMNKRMSAELQTMREELARTRREFENTKSQLRQKHGREKISMTKENDRARNNLMNLNKELEKNEMRYKQLIVSLQTKIRKLEDENRALKTKHSNQEFKLELDKRQEYEAEIAGLKQTIEKHLQALKTKDEAFEQKEQDNLAMGKNIKTMTVDIAEMKIGQDTLVEGQKQLLKMMEEMKRIPPKATKNDNQINVPLAVDSSKEKHPLPPIPERWRPSSNTKSLNQGYDKIKK